MGYNFNYDSHKPHALYKVIRPIAAFISKSKYKIKYIGVENVPTDRGFILAANHITALDPVLISSAVPKLKVHFIAKQDLFKNKLVGWFLVQLNSFPVDRSKFDRRAIDYAISVVKSGEALGIFPEGTRSKDYTPHNGKGGIGYIARECKCDIVPVSIYTSDEAKSGTRLTIRYGKPIKYEDLHIPEDSVKMKDVRFVGNLVMDRIRTLWEEGHGD